MARFSVRVELYGYPNEQVYENLHTKMQKKRYLRVVKDDNGNWYHMPSAEYTASFESKTAVNVANEIKKIADSVWTDAAVFVTKSSGGRQWRNLRDATADEVEELTAHL